MKQEKVTELGLMNIEDVALAQSCDSPQNIQFIWDCSVFFFKLELTPPDFWIKRI